MQIYLIGGIAERAGISADTVRSYCRQGLLHPIRDSSGRRLFTEADLIRIREIYMDNMTRRPSQTGALR